jgi:hypothetical protein
MNQFLPLYTSCPADKIIVLFTNRFSLLIFASSYPILPWDIIQTGLKTERFKQNRFEKSVIAFQRRW